MLAGNLQLCGQCQLRLHLAQGFLLDLADTFCRYVELRGQLVQCGCILIA